ncbi:MAG: hypothetical protein PHY23_10720 [Oscillospiraceae bacterium]|jgi:hypothetical protein|nr:hypothetical protein [Oscillospiraceae bacterium]
MENHKINRPQSYQDGKVISIDRFNSLYHERKRKHNTQMRNWHHFKRNMVRWKIFLTDPAAKAHGLRSNGTRSSIIYYMERVKTHRLLFLATGDDKEMMGLS